MISSAQLDRHGPAAATATPPDRLSERNMQDWESLCSLPARRSERNPFRLLRLSQLRRKLADVLPDQPDVAAAAPQRSVTITNEPGLVEIFKEEQLCEAQVDAHRAILRQSPNRVQAAIADDIEALVELAWLPDSRSGGTIRPVADMVRRIRAVLQRADDAQDTGALSGGERHVLVGNLVGASNFLGLSQQELEHAFAPWMQELLEQFQSPPVSEGGKSQASRASASVSPPVSVPASLPASPPFSSPASARSQSVASDSAEITGKAHGP